MNKILFLLVIIAFVSVEAQKKENGKRQNRDFLKWRNKYKKDRWASKDSESLERRAERVLKAKEKCEEHNKKGLSWTCGSNEDDHLSSDEFKERYHTATLDPAPVMEPRALPTDFSPTLNSTIVNNLPARLDLSGFCPPVKSQGRCGSCWAFAALTALECWRKMKNLPSITFSEQFLIDCDTYNNKCSGGSPSNAFRSFLYNIGMNCPSETDYPYTSFNYTSTSTGYSTCKNTTRYPVGFTKDYRIFVNGNETLMKQILANNGVVAVYMYIGNGFRSYKSGVYYDPACPVATATVPQCDGSNIHHVMNIVGYDVINNIPVWKVLNSWGSGWGTDGYGYVRRDATNNCNFACYAIYVS